MKTSLHKPSGEVTMRDVARSAGVSLMTVSNVINGRFGSMSMETKSRIEEAIKSLAYRPRASARGLRLERNLTIGMLIVDPVSNFLADPFISQVVAGVSNRVGAMGYGCLVHGVSPNGFDASVFLRFARTDGLCVFLSGSDEEREHMLQRLFALGEPLVAIGDRLGIGQPDFSVVRQDDRRAGAELVARLLERGARSIGMMVPATVWPAMQARVDGAREAASARLPANSFTLLTCGSGSVADSERALRSSIAEHGVPDAVIAGTDRLGIAARRILGSDSRVLLGGFYGVDYLHAADPNVIVAHMSAYDIGLKAAELLIERIERGSFAAAETVLAVSFEDELTA